MRFAIAARFSAMSHLLTTIIKARPSSITCRAMVKSCLSKGALASNTRTTTSANRIDRRVSPTDMFSSFSFIRAFRRNPAVSTKRTSRPLYSHAIAMASRVTPASGPVNSRSWPNILLIIVDFPTLGRPIIASFNGRTSSSSLSSPSSLISA